MKTTWEPKVHKTLKLSVWLCSSATWIQKLVFLICDQGQFTETPYLSFFTAKLKIVIVIVMRITGDNSRKDFRWFLVYGELDIIRNVFLLASWQDWIRDHGGEIRFLVFKSIKYCMQSAKNQCLILRAQTRVDKSFPISPLPLDSLLHSRWWGLCKELGHPQWTIATCGWWTDRSFETWKSDTSSNRSENETAHFKLLHFQIFFPYKREEMFHYLSGDGSGGNAFFYCYESLFSL